MPTRNVLLTQHFDNFIASGIKAGQYSSASEVVRECLRLLEQRDEEDKAKIEWLRGAVQEGIDDIDGGDYASLTSPDEITSHLHSMRTRR